LPRPASISILSCPWKYVRGYMRPRRTIAGRDFERFQVTWTINGVTGKVRMGEIC
jgi:hypothetical protein